MIENNTTQELSKKEKHRLACKRCYEKNKEKRRETQKKYRVKNKEKINDRVKEWQQNNKERVLETARKYIELNREQRREYIRKYLKENPHKRKQTQETTRKWNLKNREKIKRQVNERYHTDIQHKLGTNLRNRLYNAIKRNKVDKHAHTLELLGCDLQTLKHYIELQFVEGMSWENYNYKTWHIDHIKPVNIFDLTDTEQQKQCFHYTNLRPLWAAANLKRPKNGQDVLVGRTGE